ncbi:leukocidin/hemolysin toxin family protein [Photobacterium sp. TY1-4]|uniref:leukocidin/hemolysin toxin family protein n=1 Tax=Photobacterium sp. TY1-4 TaxID=2899122 RepID=UPI0021C1FC5E|nr:leukocidin/hemolysin toxin family protein [Photobacterium sp. TY1-4]UXI03168.1 leukocidin/hemolysin toxin family protein [Photobacterium sp. TY1-4]
MNNKHLSVSVVTLALLGALAPAHAEDTLKAYTSTLLELDDSDARAKKIRLIYSLENVWNQSLLPSGAKEAKLILNGGSGFDMTNVPNKEQIYGFSTGGDYRYTIPTAFKLALSYLNGAPLRHMSHAPENTIATTSVSESLDFNLGFTASQSPSIGGGISWSNRISYDQPEFQTVADFSQTNESISWLIENQTIRNHTPPKDWLLYHWTSCDMGNLIDYSELPVVMRSDFKPQVGVVYRKDNINDGEDVTDIKLVAGWRKTNYYFGRDWCSWYTSPENTWKKNKDSSQWTETSRAVTIAWNDELYH